MKSFGRTFGDKLRQIDPILFACTFILSVISLLTIFGAVDNFGRSKLIMQSAMVIVGTVGLFVLANFDYRFFVERFSIFMFLGSVLILAITLLFGSTGENMETANRSWLNIPFINIAIQPSEFVKLAFLCTFAKHLDTVRDRINKPKTLLFVLLHAGLIAGLILLSGDLGVCLVYFGIIAVMLYCAGLSGWYFVGVFALLVIAFPFLWDFLRTDQQNRIIFGFKPELDAENVGMQALMSRDTIASGGFFGQGLFGGSLYEDLPASHTDFIFSTVCEKFGFFGGFIVVATLVVMAFRLIWISRTCRDGVGKLICGGIAAIIILQTVENLWMCVAAVPVIGITLPFVSYGGSSMLAMYLLMGLAHSVSAQEKKFFFRRKS
jgi:rod shape determining protein RodA